MNIALAQQAVPPNHESALQRGIQAVRTAAARGADLVVFPELSFTPFYPQVPADERAESLSDLAEPVPGSARSDRDSARSSAGTCG